MRCPLAAPGEPEANAVAAIVNFEIGERRLRPRAWPQRRQRGDLPDDLLHERTRPENPLVGRPPLPAATQVGRFRVVPDCYYFRQAL